MINLDSIFDAHANNAIDPVCKMTVNINSPAGGTSEYRQQVYYFCNKGCRQAFEIDQAKYLDSSHSGEHPE